MPKIDLDALPQSNATGYPIPFAAAVAGRWYRRLAPVAGLHLIGASQVVLKPGAWSSQRHWHDGEDELVIVLAGAGVLVEDDVRTPLQVGDIAAFPAGAQNGHHIRNESAEDFAFVAISAGPNTGGGYSDIDMMWTADDRYVHKDGTPYPGQERVRPQPPASA